MPQQTLLIATTNPDKLREIAGVLGGLPIAFKTLKDFPGVETAEETGASFEENALQKARHYAAATGLPTMAEDSGFEVDALGGEPGIYSARFLRPDASYPERFDAIYDAVKKKGTDRGAARFVCALAFVSRDGVLFHARGVVEGRLAAAPAGSGGFGYDPIFYYPPYGRTFGQVTPEEKAAVSHRGQAMRAFRTYLEQHL